MKLDKKTLEKLEYIIIHYLHESISILEEYNFLTTMKSFFYNIGVNPKDDTFVPACYYVETMLEKINGTDLMEQCIMNTFSVKEYIERIDDLDELIIYFNKYLMFDGFIVKRDNIKIVILKIDPENIIIGGRSNDKDYVIKGDRTSSELTLNIDIKPLNFGKNIANIIQSRLDEIEICLNNDAYLASIILIGSVMEAIFYDTANKYIKEYNSCNSTPKKQGKPIQLKDWSLNNFVDVSFELGIIGEGAKRFSHDLRYFRNYIHPGEQIRMKFNSDRNTATMCVHALKTVIDEIIKYKNKEVT